jgi:thiol-disulfide isomerase/thioredoxin
MVIMMILYRIFSKTGMSLLLGLLLYGCSQKPKARAASTAQITQKIQSSTAPLLLVHIWATWCDPCREEFPELVKVQEAYASKSLTIILVSADDPGDPATVEYFLKEQRCPMNSLIAANLDQKFIESFSPTWSGALPSTFFFGPNGKLLVEWEGKKSYAHYAETIETLLRQPQGDSP